MIYQEIYLNSTLSPKSLINTAVLHYFGLVSRPW